MLDRELDVAISDELRPDERLLWSGAPAHGLRMRRIDLLFMPFSLAWAGFAVFWEVMVLRDGAPLVMALFGVPFLIIGAHMVFGRFISDAIRRRNTAYALTDRRVLIVRRRGGMRVESFDLSRIGPLTIQQHGDRTATLILGWGPDAAFDAAGRRNAPPRLEWVTRGRELYELILEQREILSTTCWSWSSTS